MIIEDVLKKSIFRILNDMGINFPENNIVIEKPRNPEHGDFSTNTAMKLAKELKKAPKLIADDIIDKIDPKEPFKASNLNGFINFVVNDNIYIDSVNNIDSIINSKKSLGKGKTVLIEFVSANPTGPLHIGHGRWAAIGDSLIRILNELGYKALSEFYINDAGNQINKYKESVNAVKEGKEVPEDGYHGEYIKDLAKLDVDPVEYMINHQKEILKTFKCEFNKWFCT